MNWPTLLSAAVIIGALGYAGTHPDGMDTSPAPAAPTTHVVDSTPTPAPDICAALRAELAKRGQHIDDCHSETERTVG